MMESLKVKALVCCHKNDVLYNGDDYFPIHVGKSVSNADLGIEGDDNGDNISSKNPSYCELTGLYWAWKNLGDADIVGLCHYRRYFDFHKQCKSWAPYSVFPTSDIDHLDFSIPSSIKKAVMEGHVVVSSRTNCSQNLMIDYCVCHNSDDYRVLEAVINTTQSAKVRHSFEKIMIHNNKKSTYNMFLMRRSDFNGYCEWLFSILGEVENRIDITHYNSVQKRIYGYMGERLLNVWLDAQKKEVIRKPIIWLSDSDSNMQGRSRLIYSIRCLLNNIACILSAPRYKNV